MSDMPERIWCIPDEGHIASKTQGYYEIRPRAGNEAYIRSDIHEQRVKELEAQITNARNVLTEYSHHNQASITEIQE